MYKYIGIEFLLCPYRFLYLPRVALSTHGNPPYGEEKFNLATSYYAELHIPSVIKGGEYIICLLEDKFIYLLLDICLHAASESSFLTRRRSEHLDRNVEFKQTVLFRTTPTHLEITIPQTFPHRISTMQSFKSNFLSSFSFRNTLHKQLVWYQQTLNSYYVFPGNLCTFILVYILIGTTEKSYFSTVDCMCFYMELNTGVLVALELL